MDTLEQYKETTFIYFIPDGSDGKESACNAGDPGSIPESGRSPGEGNVYSFQYTFLENSMERGDWWASIHGGHRVGYEQVNNTHMQYYTVYLSHLLYSFICQ